MDMVVADRIAYPHSRKTMVCEYKMVVFPVLRGHGLGRHEFCVVPTLLLLSVILPITYFVPVYAP